jgi:hypothetical protein
VGAPGFPTRLRDSLFVKGLKSTSGKMCD